MPRILLAQCYTERDIWDDLFGDLSAYRAELLARFPEMASWIPAAPFDRPAVWGDNEGLKFSPGRAAISCRFLADNLATPSTVLTRPASPTLIADELRRARARGQPYSHVGFSVYVDSFTEFRRCVAAVRAFDRDIHVVAGNVGALFEETADLVDQVCRGEGVRFLRSLLGEDPEAPYQARLLEAEDRVRFMGLDLHNAVSQLVTRVGCAKGCDFCPTVELFGGQRTRPLVSPSQVHAAMVSQRRALGRDFRVAFCEPSALTPRAWWYELFRLFEGEPGDYPVVITASADVLQGLDLDRIAPSSLRLEVLNIGVESPGRAYRKNRGVDLKQLISRLAERGIASYATMIVGFDHQSPSTIWDEIDQLLELGAAFNYVENLHILPGTALWRQYQRAERLLDVPEDFFCISGFQAFRHPHFAPGFEEMLPLMRDVQRYIERENGPQGFAMLDMWRRLPRPGAGVKRDTKTFALAAKLLYPSWQRCFEPTPRQRAKYLARSGDPEEVPAHIRLLARSAVMKRATNLVLSQRR